MAGGGGGFVLLLFIICCCCCGSDKEGVPSWLDDEPVAMAMMANPAFQGRGESMRNEENRLVQARNGDGFEYIAVGATSASASATISNKEYIEVGHDPERHMTYESIASISSTGTVSSAATVTHSNMLYMENVTSNVGDTSIPTQAMQSDGGGGDGAAVSATRPSCANGARNRVSTGVMMRAPASDGTDEAEYLTRVIL